jgi:hypothetical protein
MAHDFPAMQWGRHPCILSEITLQMKTAPNPENRKQSLRSGRVLAPEAAGVPAGARGVRQRRQGHVIPGAACRSKGGGQPKFGDLFSPALEELLGPRRQPVDPLVDRHRDIARSVQAMYGNGACRLAIEGENARSAGHNAGETKSHQADDWRRQVPFPEVDRGVQSFIARALLGWNVRAAKVSWDAPPV